MTFWIVAALLALVVCALIVIALLRGREVGLSAAEYDLRVYRDQLREVERDVERGTVTDTEAERVRTEVSRRLLEADRTLQQDKDAAFAPRPLSVVTALAIGTFIVGGALALYGMIGAPGYLDLPLSYRLEAAGQIRATRPDQTIAEADLLARMPTATPPDPKYLELMKKLRETVAERPDDLRGQMLLARNEAALGNFAAAHAAQTRVIELRGAEVSASDYADLADLMVLAAGGYVSPQAEEALQDALRRDPRNGAARYYLGLMHVQTARPDLGFQIWRTLLTESKPDAPWIAPIRAQIEDVAALAGVRFELPAAPVLPGPTAGDVAAAADMDADDRQAMIRTMVEGLAERLATRGGAPEEWARLIGALGVLDERDRAASIWTEAQTTFADQPEALSAIRAAAERAGVAQ